MSLADWTPTVARKVEDAMLLRYWHAVGGLIFTEVMVGRGGVRKWGKGAKLRRIDGVRIVSPMPESMPSGLLSFNKLTNAQKFQQMASGAVVEVIEVKRLLNRFVLGQVIVGADLLEEDYSPAQINQVVICRVGDPVLEWVGQKRNIKVCIDIPG